MVGAPGSPTCGSERPPSPTGHHPDHGDTVPQRVASFRSVAMSPCLSSLLLGVTMPLVF